MTIEAFICYSTHDRATADAAYAALEADGIRGWMAPHDISAGAEWAGAIVAAIDRCDVLVVIFSSHANASKQVSREVQRAFERGVPVVPLRIEDVAPAQALAYYMGSVHWLDALPPPVEPHLRQLAAAVRAAAPEPSPHNAARDAPTGREPVRRRGPVPWPVWVGAGAACVVVALIAWRLAGTGWLSVLPPDRDRAAGATDGTFKGTMQCEKLPWTNSSLDVAVVLSVQGRTANFSRNVYSGDGKRLTGYETGTGTVEADGTVRVRTSWASQTNRFDGDYAGHLTATGGTLSGKQTLEVDGARYVRPCAIVLQKASA
jgi:hypothetical protein